MEGKNESKHTPGKWVEGHGLMSPQEMVDALLEENERLKKENASLGKGLEQTQIDYYENKIESVIRNEIEKQAEVDRLTKEQDMQQKALDWDRYKKHLAEQKVQTLESEAIRLRERHNKHGIAYSKLKTENDRLTKEKSDTIKLLADVYESVEQNGTIYEALEKKVIILIK